MTRWSLSLIVPSLPHLPLPQQLTVGSLHLQILCQALDGFCRGIDGCKFSGRPDCAGMSHQSSIENEQRATGDIFLCCWWIKNVFSCVTGVHGGEKGPPVYSLELFDRSNGGRCQDMLVSAVQDESHCVREWDSWQLASGQLESIWFRASCRRSPAPGPRRSLPRHSCARCVK